MLKKTAGFVFASRRGSMHRPVRWVSSYRCGVAG